MSCFSISRLLKHAVSEGEMICVSLRNNKKLLAFPIAYDKHFNMVLKEATEIWTEEVKRGCNVMAKVKRDRYVG